MASDMDTTDSKFKQVMADIKAKTAHLKSLPVDERWPNAKCSVWRCEVMADPPIRLPQELGWWCPKHRSSHPEGWDGIALLTPAAVKERDHLYGRAEVDQQNEIDRLITEKNELIAEFSQFKEEQRNERSTRYAERDRLASQVSALREVLEEIRRSLPYPSGYQGQKVEGGEWSVPPTTARELRRLVGTRTVPAELLADTEATAKLRDQRVRLEGAQEFVRRVDARAEADIVSGKPIEGAHHRGMVAELADIQAKCRSNTV